MTQESPPSLKKSLIIGSVWMIGLRWSMKASGLINIMILARLLTPDDFGLVAMCAVIAAFVDLLFSLGVDVALIQKKEVNDVDLNAAWSLQIMQGSCAALLIAAISPLAVSYYDDDRVLPILLVLAIGVFIRGFKNTGVIFFKRDLNFNLEFKFQIAVTLIRITATILFALSLRTYWALIIGTVIGYALEVMFSYLFHKYRPHFALKGAGDIWSFSKWMIVFRTSQFFSLSFDKIVLGGLTTSSNVGIYNMANELAHLPNDIVTGPVQQALVPGFSKLKYDSSRLSSAYLRALAAAAIISLPFCIGIALIADELVAILLGDQWTAAGDLIKILAFFAAARSLTVINSAIMMAAGMIKLLSATFVVTAIVYLSLIVTVHEAAGLDGVSQLRSIVTILTLIALISIISRRQRIPSREVIATLWRPMIGILFMALSVQIISTYLPEGGIWLPLTIKAITGATSYAAVVILLWFIAGKPNSIESDIFSILGNKLNTR